MNIFFPPNQDRVFVVMFFLGLLLGVIYDMFKIKRHIITTNKWLLIIDDVIFSILSIILFLLTVFIVNNGVLRWFEPFMCFVGLSIYRMTISRLVLKCAYFVSDILTGIIKFALRILVFPIMLLIKTLNKHILKPSIVIMFRKKQQHRITSNFHKFT